MRGPGPGPGPAADGLVPEGLVARSRFLICSLIGKNSLRCGEIQHRLLVYRACGCQAGRSCRVSQLPTSGARGNSEVKVPQNGERLEQKRRAQARRERGRLLRKGAAISALPGGKREIGYGILQSSVTRLPF